MSSAYGQNNRTLNLDTLFVRDIVFKDFANNPIPANQPLVSRGDGGTYFTSSFASTIALPAINAIVASTVTGPYQFAPIGAFNTFNLTAAASMQFYSNADNGGLIIYNIGPEQIIADGQVLPFTDLPDYTVGGRTLQYVGTGDTYLQVSDATIFFNSVYNSSVSTVLFLQSTTIGLENELNSSLSILNSLVTSSGLYNYNLISSYFLTPNVINISTVSTSLLVLGDNYIKDTPLRDSIYDPCIVYTGSTLLSTNTDFLTFTDNFSGVTFAIDKEYLYASSTLRYGPSTTTVTRGQQVQLGWFPTLSTQTNTQSLRAQFVPVIQQIQVLEQLVSTSGYSTTTNYYMKNIGRFDEICNPNKISLIAPVIGATLRKNNAINNSWVQYDTTTSTIVWGNNGGVGTLPVASNYGDYAFWNGTTWVAGFSTISIGDQAGGGFITGEGQGEAAVAIGAAAGYSTQGAYAIAMGYTAGQYAQGETAIAIGNAAGNTNQGSNTVAIGNYAGGTVQGDLGIAIGDYAGFSNQQRAGVAIGRYAGQYNQHSNSVAIGNEAGNSNQQESAVAIGDNAGLSQSSFGIAIGLYAGCTQDENAIAIGSYAGYNIQNQNTVAIGNYAGGDVQDVESVAIGDYAGVVQSSFAVAIGYYAGNNNQNVAAIAIGSNAGSNNQGRFAVAIGAGAGRDGQSTCTIVLNATGQNLNTIHPSSLYIAPIRYDSTVTAASLQYNTVTKEIVWNDGGGNVIGSTMTQSLIPDVDNAYDIGTSTLRLRHLYVGPSSLTIGTGSISADNGGNLYATNASGTTVAIGGGGGGGTTINTYSTLYTSTLSASTINGLQIYTSSINVSSINGMQFTGPLATDNFCVAVGDVPNKLAYSYDGLTWNGCIPVGTPPFPAGYGNCVAWNGTIWLAGGTDDIGEYNTLGISSDGIHWTNLGNPEESWNFQYDCYGIAWNGNMWVAVGDDSQSIQYSYDGIHWYSASPPPIIGLCVAWNGTMWVVGGAISGGPILFFSYDGIHWEYSNYSDFSVTLCVAWNGTMWIAGGQSFSGSLGLTIAYSYDGINWSPSNPSFSNVCKCVAWNGTIWVAGGWDETTPPTQNYNLAYSTDGITWTPANNNVFSYTCFSVTWNGSYWIAVGVDPEIDNTNTIAYSVDGMNWTGLGNNMFSGEIVSTNPTGGYGIASRTVLPYVANDPLTFLRGPVVAIGEGAGGYHPQSNSVAIGTGAGLYSNNGIAIGTFAGFSNINSNINQIAIGSNAGYDNQGSESIAIGTNAGYVDQEYDSVAIGNRAGWSNQGAGSIALGNHAGESNQSPLSIAIGQYAGAKDQSTNTIVLNATGGLLNTTYDNSFYVAPIRYDSTISTTVLQYNTNTNEVVWTISFTCMSTIAYGAGAGAFAQGLNAVAIGASAGQNYQNDYAIALGYLAGSGYQSTNAIAIGQSAGNTNQGAYGIAIGAYAGLSNQHDNSIVLNATGVDLNTTNSNAFYVSPIRSDVGASNGNLLYYDTGTGEIIYDTTKTFVINHPKDEFKYLVHACLEGPEAGVYYRGTGTIAELETGVEVELPDYVDALATELTVQVTPIYNGSVRVLNTSCVSNNKFTVYGDSGDFHWHVYGRRASVVVEPKKSDVAVLGEGPYRWIA